MTVTQLKYFLALAETLNFSQVAQQFFVAQTAISYSIKALETELNVRLFERTTKKVSLTAAGQMFYNRVRTAVQIIDQAQINMARASERQLFTVGCSRLCSGPTFYRAAESFQRNNPDVKLFLCADEPELHLLDRLSEGQIDLAIYMKAPYITIPSEAVTHTFAARLPRQVIVSTGHPWSSRTEGIPAEELSGETMVSYANLETTRRYLPTSMTQSLLEKSISQATVAADFHSMLDMIAANLGVACLPMVDGLNTESLRSVECLEDLHHFPLIGASCLRHNRQGISDRFVRCLFNALEERFPDGRAEFAPGAA